MTVQIPGLKSTMTATVDFGDQSPVVTIQPFVPSTFSHLYPPSVSSPTTFIVTLTVTLPGCTPVVITKTISITCGHYYAKTVGRSQGYFGGRLWQLSGAIWAQNNKAIFDLGASSQVYRYGSGEVVKYAKNANSLDVNLQGKVLDAAFTGSGSMFCDDVTISSVIITSSGPASYLARRPSNIPTGLRFEEGALFSDHHATIGTGGGSLPLKVEKLYLTDK